MFEQSNLRNRAELRPPTWYEGNIVKHSISATFQEAVTESNASKSIEAINDELGPTSGTVRG